MLKQLVLVTMFSIAAFGQDPATNPQAAQHAQVPTRAKKLTNAEFDGYLAHPEKVLVLDVRRPDEISTIGGFPVYLSIQIQDLRNHFSEIPKDRPIITVSNHAARASIAADLLADHGFKVLGAVGADTYQKDGGTLAVKFPVPPPHAPAGTDTSAASGNRATAAGGTTPQ